MSTVHADDFNSTQPTDLLLVCWLPVTRFSSDAHFLFHGFYIYNFIHHNKMIAQFFLKKNLN